MRKWALVFLICSVARAEEKIAIDSLGRVIGLLSGGTKLTVSSGLVAVLAGGQRIPLQVRQGSQRGIRREGPLAWSGSFALPGATAGQYRVSAEEDASSVRYTAAVTPGSALDLDALEFVVDLPRGVFANGRLSAHGAADVAIPTTKPPDGAVYRGETASLRLDDAAGKWMLNVAFEKPYPLALIDRYDTLGRSYQLRVTMARGRLAPGANATLATTFGLIVKNTAPQPPVHVTLDSSRVRFHFDGFGGNYCFSNGSPVTAFTLDNLKSAWARYELKATAWDTERDNPGPVLRKDFETMRRLQQAGAKSVISIWWLPERLYTDPNQKTRNDHFRIIDRAKWNDALDLVGSYLLYAKREYGVEPDLFSFNEANVGVYVGFTPETHAEEIKKFGAYFQKLGLKTKMLLGDTTGLRDTHKWVLAAAADPEAMQYVGAVAFHSWGGGTPQNYTDWGDVAEWLKLPLLVDELGVDGMSHTGRLWDAYDYGMREAEMTQELLTYARPQGTQYWEFTSDYALGRVTSEGKVEPYPRFWLIKHFNDLTPQQSDALAIASDESSVLVTAFRAQGSYALHVLNLGLVREAVLAGLPDGDWRVTQSTESKQFESRQAGRPGDGTLRLQLPARSLVTLTTQAAGNAPSSGGR